MGFILASGGRVVPIVSKLQIMKDSLEPLGSCLIAIGVMVYGLAQLVAGYVGIAHHWGAGWATAALVVAFVFRMTLPLTIGAFFGAMNVWGWPWYFALAFSLPGVAIAVALLVPGLLAVLWQRSKRSK